MRVRMLRWGFGWTGLIGDGDGRELVVYKNIGCFLGT